MPVIEILSAIICDEVRRESSGRAVLLGAAPVGPELSEAEENIVERLAFYIETRVLDVSNVEFRLISEDQKAIPFQVVMNLSDDEDENEDDNTVDRSEEDNDQDSYVVGTIVFNRKDLKFGGPGVYRLEYAITGDDWRKVRDFYFPPERLE